MLEWFLKGMYKGVEIDVEFGYVVVGFAEAPAFHRVPYRAIYRKTLF